MCSGPTQGEAVSPAAPVGPCHAGLIQPLSMCHCWHPVEGIQLYSAVDSGKVSWVTEEPSKSQREGL